MRRKWFLIGAMLAIAMLAPGAAGCGDDDEGEGGNGEATTPAAGATTPATRATTPAAGDGAATEYAAIIAGVDDDTIGGAVVIAEGGDGVEVIVDVLGLPEGSHANHLHHGTCEEQGEVHVTLTELEPDADGIATAETTFDDPPLEHFATGHYYAVHSGAGAVIGCGNVVESG
jgi:hypothetical protein